MVVGIIIVAIGNGSFSLSPASDLVNHSASRIHVLKTHCALHEGFKT